MGKGNGSRPRSDSWLSKLDAEAMFDIAKQRYRGIDIIAYIRKQYGVSVSRSAFYNGLKWIRQNESTLAVVTGVAQSNALNEMWSIKNTLSAISKSINETKVRLERIEEKLNLQHGAEK